MNIRMSMVNDGRENCFNNMFVLNQNTQKTLAGSLIELRWLILYAYDPSRCDCTSIRKFVEIGGVLLRYMRFSFHVHSNMVHPKSIKINSLYLKYINIEKHNIPRQCATLLP